MPGAALSKTTKTAEGATLLCLALSHHLHRRAPMVTPAPREHPFKPALPIAGFSLPAICLAALPTNGGRTPRMVK